MTYFDFAKELTRDHAELLKAERALYAPMEQQVQDALNQQRNVPEDSTGEKS